MSRWSAAPPLPLFSCECPFQQRLPYMPLLAQRMRLCFTHIRGRQCESASTNALSGITTSSNTVARTASGGSSQRRVLLTTRRQYSPLERSPHQWSHIAHSIRNPRFLSSGAAMAKNQDTQVRRQGHSHGHHHHHHDNTYLTSSNKSDPGVRITRIGLYVNLGMAIAKGAGGYLFNSQA